MPRLLELAAGLGAGRLCCTRRRNVHSLGGHLCLLTGNGVRTLNVSLRSSAAAAYAGRGLSFLCPLSVTGSFVCHVILVFAATAPRKGFRGPRTPSTWQLLPLYFGFTNH